MRAVNRRRRLGESSGQSMVELALVLPFIVVLLVGAAQVGALMYGQITIDTAAREGARVASLTPETSGAYSSLGVPNAVPQTCPAATTSPACIAIWNSAGFISNPKTSLTLSIAAGAVIGAEASPASCSASWVNDGTVIVTVKYDSPIFVPFLNQLFSSKSGARTLQSVVTMRVAPCTITKGK